MSNNPELELDEKSARRQGDGTWIYTLKNPLMPKEVVFHTGLNDGLGQASFMTEKQLKESGLAEGTVYGTLSLPYPTEEGSGYNKEEKRPEGGTSKLPLTHRSAMLIVIQLALPRVVGQGGRSRG